MIGRIFAQSGHPEWERDSANVGERERIWEVTEEKDHHTMDKLSSEEFTTFFLSSQVMYS
jgi:hypothetical protein